MADRDDVQVPNGCPILPLALFDDIENAKFVQPEFPCSDDIGLSCFFRRVSVSASIFKWAMIPAIIIR